ncbi:hypothetical protein OQA88_13485 [Cercophora sp. LCS_1]
MHSSSFSNLLALSLLAFPAMLVAGLPSPNICNTTTPATNPNGTLSLAPRANKRIFLGYIHAYSFPDVTYIVNIGWADGEDPCNSRMISQHPADYCGFKFCAGGECGLTVEGCGGNIWLNKNGGWYGECRPAKNGEGSSKSCNAGVFFGSVTTQYVCN